MKQKDSSSSRTEISPLDCDLKLTTVTTLLSDEPSEYVSELRGHILLEHGPDDDDAVRGPAGRIALTQYHLARARDEGQNPRAVFDCMSEASLELYSDIYEGFELQPAAVAALHLAVVSNPSLLVIEAVELLPRFRGKGLGLAAALKAMHLLAPVGGLVALIAAPLNYGAFGKTDRERWRRLMKMNQFQPDSQEVRERLGRYWKRLGFKRIGPVPSCCYLRCMDVPLPTVSEVMADVTKK